MKKNKQFCKNNHDTFIYGRTKKGQCKECKRIQERNRMRRIRSLIPKKKSGRSKVQFCPKGHDTSVTGRYKNSECILCHREFDKERYKRNNASIIIFNSKTRFCINNHDTWICGRYGKTRACIKCIRVRSDKAKMLRRFNVVAWTDWDNIDKIYNNRPDNNHVDHYIPLRGKKVYGLHVSWNLRYLISKLNQEKSNDIDLLEASEWYGKILEEAGLK